MSREFQTLRFAARERRHRLTEPQILEADVDQRFHACEHGRLVGEERRGLRNGHLEHFVHVLLARAAPADRNLERLVAEALAVAVRAAQVHVREELHLDVFEAAAGAGRAAAAPRVETEGAARVAALERRRFLGEEIADRLERADIARRIRARRAADRRLVDHHDVVDAFVRRRACRTRPALPRACPSLCAAPDTARPGSASTCPIR